MLVDNGQPYIRYQVYPNGKPWNLLVTPNESLNHVCTFKDDYTRAWAYGEQIKIYIEELEQDLKRCKAGK